MTNVYCTSLLCFGLIFMAVGAFAADREVVGGDILYTATAESPDEDLAAFLAQQAAIKLVITECAIPHKEIKIFNTKMRDNRGWYSARAQAGLSFENCTEGKKASGKDHEKLISAEIVKNQAIYEDHLAKKLGIAQAKVRKTPEEKEQERLAAWRAKQDKEQKEEDARDAQAMVRLQARHIEDLKFEMERLKKRIDNKPEPTAEESATGEYAEALKKRKAMSPEQKSCLAKYKALNSRAEALAVNNSPPGNMAQGEASVYWNQAQSLMQQCNALAPKTREPASVPKNKHGKTPAQEMMCLEAVEYSVRMAQSFGPEQTNLMMESVDKDRENCR